MLATPTTLISLLRIVALGWQQTAVADNAKKIGLLGREFYKRLSDFTDHLEGMGKHLTQAVTAYNQGVGSFERRVLVSARKFRDLDPGIAGGQASSSSSDQTSAAGGRGDDGLQELTDIDIPVRSLKVVGEKQQ